MEHGGFNFGIRKAIEEGYEYLWIMDDDTIPKETALEKLINANRILEGNYGFLSSSTLWKDEKPCKMNRQKITSDWYEKSELLQYGLIKTYYATFVSFFIKAEIVKKVGLPIKDFFIWGDDVEYTNRISKQFECYIAGESQVIHKTKNNEGSNIAKDDIERIGRYKYAYRNEVYIAKQNGLKGICRQFAKICLHIGRVIVSKNKHKLRKLGVVIGSSFKGLFFNPEIEFLTEIKGEKNQNEKNS